MRIIKALLSTSVLLVFLLPQALAAPNGEPLNIDEVAVTIGDPNTTLEITGFFFGGPLEVTLAGVPAGVTSATSTTIVATVLTAAFLPGDYRLTVSTGNGSIRNDEYDLTIGAVGPAGPQGVPGVSNYERVSALSTDTGDQKTANVSCPGGKKVLGGGFGVIDTGSPPSNGEQMANLSVLTNQPSSDTGWVVLAVGFLGGNAPAANLWNVEAFAVCATVAP